MVIIQISDWWNELDAYAQSRNRIGHSLQLIRGLEIEEVGLGPKGNVLYLKSEKF